MCWSPADAALPSVVLRSAVLVIKGGPSMLQRFIESFSKAVTLEMDSMRQRMGPYEIPVMHGERLEDDRDSGWFVYRFRLRQTDDKLVQHGECSLVTEHSDVLVTVVAIETDRIVLTSSHPIDTTAGPTTLVIYPWFLYERLLEALRALGETEGFHTDTALALFGRAPARELAGGAPGADDRADTLNESQQRAIQLCRQTTPAFVWGPPGTGKTTTLGHIVLSLLRLGQRILVTSTTNAAVDQALATLAALDDGRAAIGRGDIVRLGHTQANTHGAGLSEVVDRVNARTRDQITTREQRHSRLVRQQATGKTLLTDLEAHAHPEQQALFGTNPVSTVDASRLTCLWPASHARRVAALTVGEQKRVVERRLLRLDRATRLSSQRCHDLRTRLRQQEGIVAAEAQVVVATMTNVYMSALMQGQRFDAVIVEEAGMAILPTLFYCACLAGQRVIMVGDPRQLPPIVQSTQPFVQQAMGRSIFQVTVPDPHRSPLVVMLDTQYRMHPSIGDLVGGLFYDGRLRHGAVAHETERIAACEPGGGSAIVVVNTAGTSTCSTPPGRHSRFNDKHADIAVDMARQAVSARAGSVAIIAPYVEQVRRIGRLIRDDPGLAGRVECRTVHRFQGGERDVVIFDTVDTEPLKPGRLLSDRTGLSGASNLVNVSLSRARGKLVILADVPYFQRRDPTGVVNRMLAAAQKLGVVLAG